MQIRAPSVSERANQSPKLKRGIGRRSRNDRKTLACASEINGDKSNFYVDPSPFGVNIGLIPFISTRPHEQ